MALGVFQQLLELAEIELQAEMGPAVEVGRRQQARERDEQEAGEPEAGGAIHGLMVPRAAPRQERKKKFTSSVIKPPLGRIPL